MKGKQYKNILHRQNNTKKKRKISIDTCKSKHLHCSGQSQQRTNTSENKYIADDKHTETYDRKFVRLSSHAFNRWPVKVESSDITNEEQNKLRKNQATEINNLKSSKPNSKIPRSLPSPHNRIKTQTNSQRNTKIQTDYQIYTEQTDYQTEYEINKQKSNVLRAKPD